MDDQELKSLWQAEKPKIQQPDFEKAFKGKSTGILEKLQKTVKWEHYLNILVSILFVGFMLFTERWWYALGFGVFFTGIIFYYKRLYDKVTHITYSENVVEYLSDMYNTLKGFKKSYIIGLIVIFPISYIIGFDIGYDLGLELGSEEEPLDNSNRFDELSDWIIFAVVNIVTIAITAFIIHILFQFLYGKRIKKIKAMLDSLQEEEVLEK